jgi:hypothetical protein
VVTSQSLRPPVALVMACWHWNLQFTHPPARARRRRVDMNVAQTSAAATAALAAATSTATITAAVLKKWLTDPPNTSQATATMAASSVAGRA